MLKDPRLRDMGDGGSTITNSDKGSSSISANEIGNKNKRKFISDVSSLEIPLILQKVLSLTDYPMYEKLEEKIRSSLAEMGSTISMSEDTTEEHDEEESQQNNWDDPVACQLQELLANNLSMVFCGAMKRIAECGYDKEIATCAVLITGLRLGTKDAVSNVVEGALALLEKEKEIDPLKCNPFEGLQNLVDYTLLEMVHVLREVRPGLTIVEAMWCLLISDLNLLNACVVEESSSGNDTSAFSKSKSEISDTNQLNSENSKQLMPENHISTVARQPQSSESWPGELTILPLGTGKEIPQEATGKSNEKPGGSKKGLSSNSMKDIVRQTALQLDKSCKSRKSKRSYKFKVSTSWGSMVIDKSPKSQSSESLKGTNLKLVTPAGNNGSLLDPSGDSQSGVPAGLFSFKDSVFNSSPALSASEDLNSCQKGKIGISTHEDPSSDSQSSVPASLFPVKDSVFNSSPASPASDDPNSCQKCKIGNSSPPEDIDPNEVILVEHKIALEKEIQGWMDWANEKVMQATKRLGKDRTELKMLRQEKEEAKKIKKERQSLEENTVKRLSEMEYALSNATNQIQMAKSNLHRLEEDNSLLKKKMGAFELQSQGSAIKLQEVVVREEETIKKCQLLDKGKGLLMEKLKDLNRQKAEVESCKEKAKARLDQFKVLLMHEEKEKTKVAAQIHSIRAKREEEAALIQEEAEKIKQLAETNFNACKEQIKNLEKSISELRLESEKSKIAALTLGYDGSSSSEGMKLRKITKRLAVFEENYPSSSIKPERECVMCMSEEIAVVFIPCVHQVLCGACSERHEKQGMKDCPSCRAMIEKRILVSYAEN